MTDNGVSRRLFLVPLANNDHGKSAMIRALVNYAQRSDLQRPQLAQRTLLTPWRQEVDAMIFIRSYQETLAGNFESVEAALDDKDAAWRTRDFVLLPSHCNRAHCDEIINGAHRAGFDAIVAPVLLARTEVTSCADCTALSWDERWTIDNPRIEAWRSQVTSIGADLWAWASRALFGR